MSTTPREDANQVAMTGRVEQLRIEGRDNIVSIGEDTIVSSLRITGNGNRVEIGGNCWLRGHIAVVANGARLVIGDKTTSMGLQLVIHEASAVTIGTDCMFSSQVRIYPSDMHSIIDLESGQRINPAEPIAIGDHVWVGHSAVILKGVHIAGDSIIGSASVVTGDIPANCIAAGAPARVIRRNVTWDRRRLPVDAPVPASDPRMKAVRAAVSR